MFAPGCSQFELPPPLHGSARLGFLLFVLFGADSDPSLPLQCMTCSGSLLLASDVARSDSFLFVVDVAIPGFSSPLQSSAHVGLAVPLFEFANLGDTLPVRSYVRMGFPVSTLDCAHPDFTLLLRSTVWFGSVLPAAGVTKLDLFPSVLGVCSLGFFLLLHGCS